MTLTFVIRVIYWSRQIPHLSSSVLASSTAELGDLDHDPCPQCHLLVRTNILSKFEGPIPKHCQIIKLFSTKEPGDLNLCLQDHLLIRSNISTKFEGPNHKHCRIISFFGTQGQVILTFDLKVIYSSGPSSQLQSNFNGSNIFGTVEICSRNG